MTTCSLGVVFVALGKIVLMLTYGFYILSQLTEYVLPKIKGDKLEDFLSAEREFCSRKVKVMFAFIMWSSYTMNMNFLLLKGTLKGSVWRCAIWLCLTLAEIALATVGLYQIPNFEDILEYRILAGVWYGIHAVFVIVVFIFIKDLILEKVVDTLVNVNEA